MIWKILKAGTYTYPLISLKFCILRIRFFKHILFNLKLIKNFINNIECLGYAALFEHKIPVLGAVEWPYIHKDWDINRRFNMILSHYQIIKTLPQILDVTDGKSKVLVDTHQFSAGTKIVLDKAQWFVREGEIVLNLFKDHCRIMSIAFTLSDLNGERVLYIGAIQGTQADECSLEKIKMVTKNFEGLRPSALLMEVLRMLAKYVGVKKILGITDEYRHHHHAYFSRTTQSKLKKSYNILWSEQQAEPFGYDFYAIPIHKDRKSLEAVSSNKRAMYRRRYELLDNINHEINTLLVTTAVRQTSTLQETEIHFASAKVSSY